LCGGSMERARPTLHVGGGEPDPRREPRRHAVQGVLATALETTLRLLHPFAPFVTEEIWQKLPKPSTVPASLMVTVYPGKGLRFVDDDAEHKVGLMQEVTVAIRMLRGTYNVPPSWSVPVDLHAADDARRAVLERHRDVIENGARVTLTIAPHGPRAAQSAKAVVGADIEIIIPLAG